MDSPILDISDDVKEKKCINDFPALLYKTELLLIFSVAEGIQYVE